MIGLTNLPSDKPRNCGIITDATNAAEADTVRRLSCKQVGEGSIPSSGSMKYVCDEARHLVCIPYSIENLHQMASELGIKRCWFHKNHYDIPKKRIAEITAKCEVVSSRKILEIIKGCA